MLDRIFTLMGFIQLIIAVVFGVAAAYLLGSVFGGGVQGYALGFVLGFGLTYGAIEFS